MSAHPGEIHALHRTKSRQFPSKSQSSIQYSRFTETNPWSSDCSTGTTEPVHRLNIKFTHGGITSADEFNDCIFNSKVLGRKHCKVINMVGYKSTNKYQTRRVAYQSESALRCSASLVFTRQIQPPQQPQTSVTNISTPNINTPTTPHHGRQTHRITSPRHRQLPSQPPAIPQTPQSTPHQHLDLDLSDDPARFAARRQLRYRRQRQRWELLCRRPARAAGGGG